MRFHYSLYLCVYLNFSIITLKMSKIIASRVFLSMEGRLWVSYVLYRAVAFRLSLP